MTEKSDSLMNGMKPGMSDIYVFAKKKASFSFSSSVLFSLPYNTDSQENEREHENRHKKFQILNLLRPFGSQSPRQLFS